MFKSSYSRTINLISRINHSSWHDYSTASLFAVLLIFTLLWLLWPQEFIASDPWAYSQRAFGISKSGDFGGGHVFDHRLSVTLSTAFFYELLGVNIQTTNLASLFSCLLIIYTVWLALPDYRSKVIGTFLCLTSIPLFKSSIALLPDIIATAFMALSFQMLLFRRKVILQQATIYIPLIAVSALFTAFLAKLSAYWVLPLWIWAFASDLKSHEAVVLLRRFYLPAIITGLCLGISYLLFCSLTWDDPLSRLKAIQSLTGKHLWTWENTSTLVILKRLTVSPILMLISQYGVPILALACLSVFIASRSIRAWLYYALCCLLFFWFGSTSFTSYEPMPLVDRMTLPILPAVIVSAAYLTSQLVVSSSRPHWFNSYVPITFVILLTMIPFVQYLYLEGVRCKELAEAKTMGIVKKEVRQNPEEEFLLICSDSRSPRSLAFYFGYNYPNNLRVTYFGDLNHNCQLPKHILIFVDRRRSAFLNRAYGHVHYDAELDALDGEFLYQSSSVTLRKIVVHEQMRRLIEKYMQKNSHNTLYHKKPRHTRGFCIG